MAGQSQYSPRRPGEPILTVNRHSAFSCSLPAIEAGILLTRDAMISLSPAARQSSTDRLCQLATPGIHWLDFLVNPYAPSPAVTRAIEQSDHWRNPSPLSTEILRDRLALRYGLPPEWLRLDMNYRAMQNRLLAFGQAAGRLVLFPNGEESLAKDAADLQFELWRYRQSCRFSVENESMLAGGASTAWVQSPADPTGEMIGIQALVRLCRRNGLVIVDERHGERSARTVLPLVREFDNLIVLRSFEFWAGLPGFPVTIAFGAPALMEALESKTGPFLLTSSSIAALMASLDDLPYLEATLDRLRTEKHRMHRMLRKSNLLRPLLSGAHYELVWIERGERGCIVAALATRGIAVHVPSHSEFEQHLRLSAVSPVSTRALQAALREIGQGISARCSDQAPLIASR